MSIVQAPLVSVVITTHNRRDELLRAVESARALRHRPLEVIVYDDASSDGSQDALRERFPDVRYRRVEERVGYIVLRNRGFREARGAYVCSIDDDAYFTHPDTLLSGLAQLEASPDVAAVALPYIEIDPTGEPTRAAWLGTSLEPGEQLRSYVGCAHLIRREAALEEGGYRELLIHQGEERDLCIRLLERGERILASGGHPIVHQVSSTRCQRRLNRFGVRNALLFDILNLPLYAVPGRLLTDSVKLFLHRLTLTSILPRLLLLSRGWLACLRYIAHRRPVSIATYHRYLGLPRHGPLPPATAPEAARSD